MQLFKKICLNGHRKMCFYTVKVERKLAEQVCLLCFKCQGENLQQYTLSNNLIASICR